MGSFVSRLMDLYSEWGSNPGKMLLLGLDAAGKTTVLYKLKLDQTVTSVPTIGFNVETLTFPNGLSFTVWDIGGQERLRPLWQHYFENTHGLIFIVDSNDPTRFEEAGEELKNIITDDRMRGVPVLLLANKQDLPNSRSTSEVAEKCGLTKMTGREWHVQGCCAATGDGLVEGISVLSKYVKNFKKQNRF